MCALCTLVLNERRLEARVGRVNHLWAIHPKKISTTQDNLLSALFAPHAPLKVRYAYDRAAHVVYMLTTSSPWHFDAPCHHLSLSGIRVQSSRSNIHSAQTGHYRHCKPITAFGGYFTRRYLASFGSKQNAFVLATSKQDVRYHQVRACQAIIAIPGHTWLLKLLHNSLFGAGLSAA